MNQKALTAGRSRTLGLKRNKYLVSLPLLLLCLPAVVYLILFHYLPIFGVVVAFKDHNYPDGILGSPWVGLENFKFFFQSNDAARIIFSTIGYSIWFFIVSTFFAILIAILLSEISSKRSLRYFQTTMALPSMISWIIVAYVVYSMLSYETGVANTFFKTVGLDKVNWYNSPQYWPAILTIVRVWQGVGMNCVIYYAALMGLDESLFEAAKLDGANRFKQIWHISLPSIIPIVCVMTILEMGKIMSGDIGLFFQVPMNSPALYPTTDIINTYITRGLLEGGEMGVTAAVGLFQNAVGCILLIVTNTIIRKISPENSMF